MPKSDITPITNAKPALAEQFIPIKNISTAPKANSSLENATASSKIHFREQKGYFQRLRTMMNSLLIVLFFALPFISVNGRQAILLDVSQQQFFFLG